MDPGGRCQARPQVLNRGAEQQAEPDRESFRELNVLRVRFKGVLCDAGFRPRVTSHFGFGQSGQTHVGRTVALRVPCAVRQHRRRANSLRSNNARLFSGVGCTARPHHKARRDSWNHELTN